MNENKMIVCITSIITISILTLILTVGYFIWSWNIKNTEYKIQQEQNTKECIETLNGYDLHILPRQKSSGPC